MPTTMIEVPEALPEATNVEPEETAGETAPSGDTEGTEKPEAQTAPTEESGIEIDGQRLTASQIKEFREAYENKKAWERANTIRAQEIAQQRKEAEEALILRNLILQRPEILQQITQPGPDVEQQLRAIYDVRPEDVYSAEYREWERRKDALLAENARASALREAETRVSQTLAQQANARLTQVAWEKYKDKITQADMESMATWIVQNVRDQKGIYPDNAYDLAYRELFWEKAIRDAKLESTKSITKSIERAKSVSEGSGIHKPTEQLSPEDEEHAEVAREVRRRMSRGKLQE